LYRKLKGATPKNCFNNSFKALTFNLSAKYVLGYIFVHNIPIEHCWIREDDTHYDITINPTLNNQYFFVSEFSLQ